MEYLVSILVATIAAGTPLVFAALGELVTEKSNVLNLGVEGMMLVGAIAAAYALHLVLPTGVTKVLALGTPAITATITLGKAIAIEALLTFFLMSAMLGTTVSAEAPKVAGFGVGLTLFIGVLFGGPLTGAALNPARAFGPALVSGQWISQSVYWIGPILGALVAAFLWEKVLFPRATD